MQIILYRLCQTNPNLYVKNLVLLKIFMERVKKEQTLCMFIIVMLGLSLLKMAFQKVVCVWGLLSEEDFLETDLDISCGSLITYSLLIWIQSRGCDFSFL